MPTLKILIGIPASGKSTWAREFVSKNANWCIVSRDDFRYGWQNRGWLEPKFETIITEMVEKSIETLIGRGINVIYDATNCKASSINDIIRIARHIADVEYQIFDVPFDVAVARDSKRDRSVGVDVIRKMHSNYVNLLETFDFSPIKRSVKKYIAPVVDYNKPHCIIVDVDGTLAHTSGKRSPYDETLVDTDDIDEIVRLAVNSIVNGHQIELIVVSGRTDSCYDATKSWLESHGIFASKMFMRKTGDSRKDNIVKEEIFWEHIAPHYNVLAVFDDRDQVVKMWRSLGLKCFQVEYGNF